ncbi:hypothetical protein GG496_001103 [Candidatus Fervidibacteria bacterium JGI MDM2 JNZ-1-D12]
MRPKEMRPKKTGRFHLPLRHGIFAAKFAPAIMPQPQERFQP